MSDGIRGLGGIFIAVAVYLLAQHLGMEGWKLWAVVILVGLGVPMAITGRFKSW